MKRSAVIAVAAIFVLLAGLVTAGLLYLQWIGAPTVGPSIGSYENPKTAVLVIDLQQDFVGPEAVRKMKQADETVKEAGMVAAGAVARDEPVAYIRAVYPDRLIRLLMGGLAAPDEPGSMMDQRLPSVPSIRTFSKTRGDAFSNTELDAWLRENRVDHIIVTGIDAFYCVDDTIRGALNRGYRVTAIMTAISTGTDRDLAEIAAEWRALGVTIR